MLVCKENCQVEVLFYLKVGDIYDISKHKEEIEPVIKNAVAGVRIIQAAPQQILGDLIQSFRLYVPGGVDAVKMMVEDCQSIFYQRFGFYPHASATIAAQGFAFFDEAHEQALVEHKSAQHIKNGQN